MSDTDSNKFQEIQSEISELENKLFSLKLERAKLTKYIAVLCRDRKDAMEYVKSLHPDESIKAEGKCWRFGEKLYVPVSSWMDTNSISFDEMIETTPAMFNPNYDSALRTIISNLKINKS